MNVPFRTSARQQALRLPQAIGGSHSLERRRLQCYLAMMGVDIALLLMAFIVSGWLYLGPSGIGVGSLMAQLILPAYLTISFYNGAYGMRSLQDFHWSAVRSAMALFLSGAVVLFIGFYTHSANEFSRVVFTMGVCVAAFGLTWGRAQMPAFVAWRCGSRVINELVIDDGGPQIDLPGIRRVSAAQFGLVPELSDPAALDRIGMLLRNVERVIVSCPPERRAPWALLLKGANIDGEVIDDAVIELGAKGARQAGGRGLLLVSLGPLQLRARAIKRGFDIAVATVALIVLAPLLAAVALAIVLHDGGPALFVQRRMGRGNTFFWMYKFRSMAVSASDDEGSRSTLREDVRITPIGRIIRRTSIDELPQLFNVLLGNMSIVGPRPHAIGSQAGDKLFWEVDDRYWLRHALKPGLTGLAQVRGMRGATERESDLADRLDSDLEYLHGWSLLRDLRILLATVSVVIHDRAY